MRYRNNSVISNKRHLIQAPPDLIKCDLSFLLKSIIRSLNTLKHYIQGLYRHSELLLASLSFVLLLHDLL